MSVEELAKILVQMYGDAEQDKEKSVMPNLFGVRFAKEIGNCYNDVITEANRIDGRISIKYGTEIYKGVRLARYVIDKQTLVGFIQNEV